MHFLLDLVPRCVVEVTRGSILIRGNESNDGRVGISNFILFSLRSVLRNRWQNSSYQPKLGLARVTQRTILPRFQSGGEGGEERETSVETSFFEQAIELWMIRREKRRKERDRESEIGISTYSLYCSTVKTKGSLSKSFLSHHLFHKSFSSLRSLGLEGKGGGKYTGASDISSYCRAFDRRGSMDRGGLTEQPRDSCPRPPLRRRRRRRGRRAL